MSEKTDALIKFSKKAVYDVDFYAYQSMGVAVMIIGFFCLMTINKTTSLDDGIKTILIMVTAILTILGIRWWSEDLHKYVDKKLPVFLSE